MLLAFICVIRMNYEPKDTMMKKGKYLGNRRVGGPGRDEGDGGGGGVVGGDGLLDIGLHLGDVAQGADRAHALEHRPAVNHPKMQKSVRTILNHF